MKPSTDICPGCLGRKRIFAPLCFGCKEQEQKRLAKEGKIKLTAKERLCNTCFVLQEGIHPRPRCNRCENRLKAVPGILPLYHWALSQCKDASRKRRIERAIADYCEQNPLVARQFRRIQAELDELKNQIVPIFRTHNNPPQFDAEGLPIWRQIQTGWRCKRCGRKNEKPKCMACEQEIRSQITASTKKGPERQERAEA